MSSKPVKSHHKNNMSFAKISGRKGILPDDNESATGSVDGVKEKEKGKKMRDKKKTASVSSFTLKNLHIGKKKEKEGV